MMRRILPIVLAVLASSACAARNAPDELADKSHDQETDTVDGHNQAGKVLAGARAAGEDAAREAAWHARENEKRERGESSKPRTAKRAESGKTDREGEKPDTTGSAVPRTPPPAR